MSRALPWVVPSPAAFLALVRHTESRSITCDYSWRSPSACVVLAACTMSRSPLRGRKPWPRSRRRRRICAGTSRLSWKSSPAALALHLAEVSPGGLRPIRAGRPTPTRHPSWTPAAVLCATPCAKAIRTPPGIGPASVRKAPCQLTSLSRTLLAQTQHPGAPGELALGLQTIRRQRGAPAKAVTGVACPAVRRAEAGSGSNPVHDHPGSGRGMVPHRKKRAQGYLAHRIEPQQE